MATNDSFDDIRIIDLDENKSEANTRNPNFTDIYLILSEEPSMEWTEIFNDVHKHQNYNMKRRARIDMTYIILEAPIEELEEHHMPRLIEVVKETNNRYRTHVNRLKAQEEEANKEKNDRTQQIKDVKKKLKFD